MNIKNFAIKDGEQIAVGDRVSLTSAGTIKKYDGADLLGVVVTPHSMAVDVSKGKIFK